jgi:site-specific DNA-methyltransferase (adenine-specific)
MEFDDAHNMRPDRASSSPDTSCGFNRARLPKHLQEQLPVSPQTAAEDKYLTVNAVHAGDARLLLSHIEPDSVALSAWSPPYFVGKQYEAHLTFDTWRSLLKTVIGLHYPLIKPGGFLAINIADILCFKDSTMPKVQAEVVSRRKSKVTKEDVLRAMTEYPKMNRHQLAALLGCSEQTIDRRINGNNIRGGKYETQTRVKIVGGMIEEWALSAGFYTYDRRIWVKDAAWENSRWATLSYRSVDEFEYIYIFWKPGITTVDRARLTPEEWREWGARGVWSFPSVRANDDHEAKFPPELPRRLIRLFTDPDEIVLDCFLGSGTTAVVALQEERRFIGIEIEKESVTLAKRQLRKVQPKLLDVH